MKADVRSDIATAATVAAGYDSSRYDGVAIMLHWITAALVLIQFVLWKSWGYFDKAARHLLIVGHMPFGMLLAAVIALRIVWRLIPGHQVSPADVGWMKVASKIVHYLLYALIASEALLGFTLRWSGNEAMSFFGVHIAPPFPPFSKQGHHLIGELHRWIGVARRRFLGPQEKCSAKVLSSILKAW